jgi:hypothetical protein
VLFTGLATVSVVVLGWLMHREAAISFDLAQRNAELEPARRRGSAGRRRGGAPASHGSCTTSSPTT